MSTIGKIPGIIEHPFVLILLALPRCTLSMVWTRLQQCLNKYSIYWIHIYSAQPKVEPVQRDMVFANGVSATMFVLLTL